MGTQRKDVTRAVIGMLLQSGEQWMFDIVYSDTAIVGYNYVTFVPLVLQTPLSTHIDVFFLYYYLQTLKVLLS